ncbi:hypothetical protein Acsp03_49070 [Actinomadura sp. NBRC 104412]|nr:hypothetical protein Acsp03_49070 [Actinomadura sp. NBRC 104412]
MRLRAFGHTSSRSALPDMSGSTQNAGFWAAGRNAGRRPRGGPAKGHMPRDWEIEPEVASVNVRIDSANSDRSHSAGPSYQ